MDANRLLADLGKSQKLLKGALQDTKTLQALLKETRERADTAEALYDTLRSLVSSALFMKLKAIVCLSYCCLHLPILMPDLQVDSGDSEGVVASLLSPDHVASPVI